MSSLPECKYGSSCYRTNPEHLKRFSHPHLSKENEPVVKGKRGGEEGGASADAPCSKKKRVDVESGNEERTASQAVESVTGVEVEEEIGEESENVRENIKKKFLVEMPEDFYQFWEFCSAMSPSDPLGALKGTLGLKLTGPYHVLAGRLARVSWKKCVLHSRHFFDPPEFLTVLQDNNSTGFHIGYFRDDPGSNECFLASNNASVGCEIKPMGLNIFAAIRCHISQNLKQKSLLQKDKHKLQQFEKKLLATAETLKLNMKDVRPSKRKVMAKCFNLVGISVPYDKKTDVGYRPLTVTNRELRQMLDKVASCSKGDVAARDKAMEPVQELITLVQFANDECDYGMGLELGLDLFCHSDHFHRSVLHLLPLAYELLQREPFALIIKEHLKNRSRTPLDMSHDL